MSQELRLDTGLFPRTLTPDDAEAQFAVTDRNRDHLRRWLPWVDATVTEQDSPGFIVLSIARLKRHEGFDAGIFVGGQLSGAIGFIGTDWRNRAAGAMIAYGFEVLVLNRVEIRYAAGNHRSMSIPVRLGFSEEGVRREAERLNDRWVDHHVFTLFRREWGAGSCDR